MKNPDRKKVKDLEELPNVGKAVAADLRLIGIERPQDLIGKKPYELYEKLNDAAGQRQDPCMLDTLLSIVHFMESGEALPWWNFTGTRKKQFKL